jgi:pyruvate ferredoxin oxidoreductase gamma subunit
MAFVRVSDAPIITREKVYEPDIVIVLDPTLLKIINVEAGLKDGGIVVINTSKSWEQVRDETGIKARLATVDASRIAMETMRVPITNTTMLGALVKASGIVRMSSLRDPINHRFGPIAEKNLYEETKLVEG